MTEHNNDGHAPAHMSTRLLGRTGLTVSELCLGAMTFGRETDEADARRLLDRFADAGGNFVDTANVYGRGASEEIVGRWLAAHDRDRFVIATKVRWPMGRGPNEQGLGRAHILREVEASLRRLGTDHIDLYQVHGWDPAVPLEDTLATLDDLVRRGLVRHVGVSNVSGWQLQKALMLGRVSGLARFETLQPQYNLLARGAEWELLAVCREEGLAVLPWSPLRGGWLTGKYHRGMTAPPEGSRVDEAERRGWSESWTNLAREETWRVVDALLAVAAQVGRPPAQVALRWVLQRPGVTSPIVGARTMEQLDGHLGAMSWTLSKEQMDTLNASSDPGLPYPYDFVQMGVTARLE